MILRNFTAVEHLSRCHKRTTVIVIVVNQWVANSLGDFAGVGVGGNLHARYLLFFLVLNSG